MNDRKLHESIVENIPQWADCLNFLVFLDTISIKYFLSFKLMLNRPTAGLHNLTLVVLGQVGQLRKTVDWVYTQVYA